MSGFWGVSKHHNTPESFFIAATRDAALVESGECISLSHAEDYRRARHVAAQYCAREVKQLRRNIAATLHALEHGPGCDTIYDYRGGIREARARIRTAYHRRDEYISTYGSPEGS